MTKTYFIDIDGVLLRHHGSLSKQLERANHEQDWALTRIDGAIELINQIEKDGGKIILVTGRKSSMREITSKQLEKCNLFYDELIMGCNRGPRIVINDLKPNSNLKTAYGFNIERNKLNKLEIEKIIKPCEERPWGNFSTLSYNEKYHIKEIVVYPGMGSSLQSHDHREELWLVIEGVGLHVTQNSDIPIKKGSVCKIGIKEVHRVKNTGSENLVFIEIQTGEMFSENDIVRYEDFFGRS